MILGYLLASRIARLGPFPACTRKIAAESRGVEIPFIVGQRIMLGEPAQVHLIANRPTCLNETNDQLIALGVVVQRRCDRQAIRSRSKTEPIAVGLHPRGGVSRFP